MTIDIIWSKQAKEELQSIFNYYKPLSEQSAKQLIKELVEAPKKIKFLDQYQVDDINSKYRRIVVRDFKILYTTSNSRINIIDIVSTKRSPDFLMSK
jgi:addiction module RelE/StbE family toxin